MSFRGQASRQAPQLVHFSLSTTAAPLGPMWSASNLQAATQEPKPRQPYLQARASPPQTLVAARQSCTPRYSKFFTALVPPLQST